ncbi:MAG: hypothetical protein HOB17_10240 [Candidatus Marinimicrobia bacterium]|jgi:hypothetical protein|nr:hypothetical protein [Candidatus Neomarinimicrobiota bacterium]MBT3760901.1 hypothetical protein [Candidatus Neomarinimicrobiota bacterium]MBT3896952.1 hypothetical protein [Candidatus Neomarinimicrobiota bacterium]MBT4538601.1 hypothetical protein [Candidatus Neomarinimicrobiota bacterium]MBT4853036.1 hypothetical protein [Candidatus Neomarinimicrobiota bacterium]
MYIKSKSYADDADCIKSLIDKCAVIVDNNGYSNVDTRSAAPTNIMHIAMSAIGMTNILTFLGVDNPDIRSFTQKLLGLTKINDDTVNFMGNSISKVRTLSLCVLGQFQIENCISNLLLVLDLSSPVGYYKKVKKIIDYLGIGEDNFRVLHTLSLIRNSLHSNGIYHGHKDSDYSTTIEGVEYNFIHNRKVTCSSMSHTAHLLERSVCVLDEIINSQPIKKITDVIPDKYLLQTQSN